MAENPFKEYKKPFLAAIGNSLLDMIVPIPSMQFVADCHISGKKILEDQEFNQILESVKTRTDLVMWPGGSAQTTGLLFQWLVNLPGYTVIRGCVGGDNYGKQMEKILQTVGVDVKYTPIQGKRTGICLSLVCDNEKAAVANLGASLSSGAPETFFTKEFRESLSKVALIYVEGFFITDGYLSIMEIMNMCKQNGNFLVFNLSSVDLIKEYFDKVLQIVTNSEVVFGNKKEFVLLAKMCNWNVQSDVKEIIKAVIKHSHSRPDKYKKQILPEMFHHTPIIVVTNGDQPVTIGQASSKPPVEYPLVGLDQNKIRNDTGGGDAFVSGFLAAAVLGFDFASCVKYGSELANIILQQVGVSIPSERPEWLQDMFKRVELARK